MSMNNTDFGPNREYGIDIRIKYSDSNSLFETGLAALEHSGVDIYGDYYLESAREALAHSGIYIGSDIELKSFIDTLMHYGTPRHSGRYPWGSGENPYQRNEEFLGHVKKLRDDGVSDVDIARGMGINTSELRRKISAANSENRDYLAKQVQKLKKKGYSNVKIGEIIGRPESSVRLLLDADIQKRTNATADIANTLRDLVDKHSYIDVTAGTELLLGTSEGKMKNATEILRNDGYAVHTIRFEQLGTGKETTMKVLCKKGTTWKELMNHKSDIRLVNQDGNLYMEGDKVRKIEPPKIVDFNRIDVVSVEQGGKDRDGLIELRPGVDDISLGKARYAQVRIATEVDGKKLYLKGMAVYNNHLPEGVDIRFNTNKSETLPWDKRLKKMKDDPDNPFGATIRDDRPDLNNRLIRAQRHYIDKDGKEQLSALNIVSEEGDWQQWSKSLASQFLSKQSPALSKKQLQAAIDMSKDEFDDIMTVNNPTVRAQMLNEFADGCDSKATHLRAAALPRQTTKCLLPVPEVKDGEVYAPGYKDGEHVILVRYPHAGVFEIPKLTVNNRSRKAKEMIGEAIDAIGINPKTASQLSGADFDGDNALVIPIDNVKGIITADPLPGLKNFDPDIYYRPGFKVSDRTKGLEMGKTTNLITDMTVRGATLDEIERVVKHSMVVIDAQKHEYDWKKSEIDNGIPELRAKYQTGGASTLLSRSTSEIDIPQRKEKAFTKMTPAEKKRYLEGEMVYEDTGKTRSAAVTKMISVKDENGHVVHDPVTGRPVMQKVKTGEYTRVGKTQKISRMDATDDATSLYSVKDNPSRQEKIYADYANTMKALAKEARKEARNTKDIEYSPEAKKIYAPEVAKLVADLNIAKKNAPLERQAQLIAGEELKATFRDNPDMDSEKKKKLKGQKLDQVRRRLGAKKATIDISNRQWEAINAGAVTKTRLKEIIDNCDKDRLKELATPRSKILMTPAKTSRAKTLLKNGYTQAEVAEMLDISVSTLVKGVGIENM